MKSKITKFIFLILLIPYTCICATYHITTESLLQQLADNQKEKKVSIIIAFPFFYPGIVTGNSLRQIKVLDKNEKEYILQVTNRTGVKVKLKDGKDKVFYFDTLIIQDSTLTGKYDHFIGVKVKPINLNSIQRIELQK